MKCELVTKWLTFTTVILHQERIAHSFLHSFFDGACPRHPRAEPELPAPYPAGVIRERDVADRSNTFLEHNDHLTRQQWPLAFSLEDNTFTELLFSVFKALVGVEIAVENEELDLHGGQGAGGDGLVAGGVSENNSKWLLVLCFHPVACEKRLRQVALELQLVSFTARL